MHMAIRLRATGELVGCNGLTLDEAGSAEVGYWIGVPYWGKGYGTEALIGLTEFAFEHTGLALVHAFHFSRNGASGRVLEKAGFAWLRHETHCCMKNGRPEPTEHFELSREAFLARRMR